MATDKRRSENDAQLEKEDPSASIVTDASASPDEHLVQLPGAQLHLISLTGKAFERTLLWKLDWWNFLYVSLFLFFPCFFFSPFLQMVPKEA